MHDEPRDYSESFGSFIKRKIAERGLNQRQAALRIGATSGMMSNWVNDSRKPSPEYVVKLAALLAVDVDEMMIRAGYRPRRDTDLHPKRAELLEVARQLPIEEADIAIGFLKWRLEEAYRPKPRPDDSPPQQDSDRSDSPEGRERSTRSRSAG